MKSQVSHLPHINKKIWISIVAFAIIVGIFFRLYNLEEKVYWVDEVATSIRIAGHTRQEIIQEFASSEYTNADILKSYQQVESTSKISDTLSALIKSPEHAPLYFLLARFWVGIFGSSVVAIRSLSVIFGLLALPCIYWLCLELFHLPQVGLISLLLLSVSPFYVAYAQEARPYSLWTVAILLSSTLFLRAIRLNNRQGWLMYSITTLIGLYTSLLSVFVISGQLLYLIILEKFRFTQTLRRHLRSVLIIVLAFLPWLTVMILHSQEFVDNTAWMRETLDLPAMIMIWITPILLIFGDLPFPSTLEAIKSTGIVAILVISIVGSLLYISQKTKLIQKSKSAKFILFIILSTLCWIIVLSSHYFFDTGLNFVFIGGLVTAFLLIALIVYSFRFSLVNLSLQEWLFITISTLSTPLALIAIDVILGGQSSGAPRYMILSQLSLQISVSYLLFSKNLTWNNSRYTWRLISVLLITVGIISCTLNLHKSPFYQKSRNLHNLPIATILNHQDNTIIFSEPDQALDLLSLSHYLKQDIKIYPLNNMENVFEHLNQDKNVFVFNPSKYIATEFDDQNMNTKLVYDPERFIPNEIVLTLWRVHE